MFEYASRNQGKALPWILGAIGLAVVVGILIMVSKGGYSKLESMPVTAFLDAPSDFLGNEYSLNAQIESQLSWQKEVGRLVAVTPEGARNRLPVFVPSEINQNLQTGQRYEMHVRIENGGLIYVESLRKY